MYGFVRVLRPEVEVLAAGLHLAIRPGIAATGGKLSHSIDAAAVLVCSCCWMVACVPVSVTTILSTYALRIGSAARVPCRVAHEHDAAGRRVALHRVGAVGDRVLLRRGARRNVVQALDRSWVERPNGQHGREVRRRVGQLVGDGLARSRHAGDLVAVDVGLDRGHRRRDLGEAGAEGLVADDQRLEVGQAAERLRRVARALEAEHRVGRGDLTRRRGVPHRAGPDRHRVGQAVVADRRRRGRQVGHDCVVVFPTTAG